MLDEADERALDAAAAIIQAAIARRCQPPTGTGARGAFTGERGTSR
jgi:hypothetical protein